MGLLELDSELEFFDKFLRHFAHPTIDSEEKIVFLFISCRKEADVSAFPVHFSCGCSCYLVMCVDMAVAGWKRTLSWLFSYFPQALSPRLWVRQTLAQQLVSQRKRGK